MMAMSSTTTWMMSIMIGSVFIIIVKVLMLSIPPRPSWCQGSSSGSEVRTCHTYLKYLTSSLSTVTLVIVDILAIYVIIAILLILAMLVVFVILGDTCYFGYICVSRHTSYLPCLSHVTYLTYLRHLSYTMYLRVLSCLFRMAQNFWCRLLDLIMSLLINIPTQLYLSKCSSPYIIITSLKDTKFNLEAFWASSILCLSDNKA